MTVARIRPTLGAFFVRGVLERAVGLTPVSRAVGSSEVEALRVDGQVSGQRDRQSEPFSQSMLGLCSRSQSSPMITSSSPMSVTMNTTVSVCSPTSMSRTATSVMVPSRFSDPSMLYRGIGFASFLVVTLFCSTNRRWRNFVVAPESSIATTSLLRCLPRNRMGMWKC